jgi:tetratricopeptide (TPR) repeat protein
MTDTESALPVPTAEQRRAAAGQYERANQVLATGNHDYAIQLFLNCCKLDPANLIYRQALRQTVKIKYGNNMKGGRFAAVTTAATRLRLRNALRGGEYLKALEHGEEVLLSNPWDVGALSAMAEAFDRLDLINPAVWSLEQARQVDPANLKVVRGLARLCEKRGNFTTAAVLWEQVRKADPSDVEAQRKAKDLAASDTIARGRYQEVASGTAEHATAETAEHPRPGATS